VIAYLDIETSFDGDITVVGVLRSDSGLVQLVRPGITEAAFASSISGIDTICTFNGERFDLPVLNRALGVDLLSTHRSVDLSVECRRLGIRGGLKAIEASMGIRRAVKGVKGYDALELWKSWEDGNRHALDKLLRYNRDDVINLVMLERRLRGDLCEPAPPEHVVLGA
jgi:hypothetical protein